MRFRPDIEGLRAVAITMVLADHLGVPGFRGGFMGVDVFFVISGFLITSLLAAERDRTAASGSPRISLRAFYGRRARRILPAAMTVIAAVLLASNLVFNLVRFEEVQADAFWATIFAANLHLMAQATDYFAIGRTLSPLQNFWSLAVEEQFYLAWPLLMIGVSWLWHGRAGRGDVSGWWRGAVGAVCVLGIASFAWAVVATGDSPLTAYYSPFTRAWELALGAAVALLVGHGVKPGLGARPAALVGAAGLTLILTGLLVIAPGDAIPGAPALLPTVGCALLLVAGVGQVATPTSALLSMRPVRFIGRISYSLYLWHWPIIVFAAEVAWLRDAWAPTRIMLLAAVSIAVSWISWRAVEQPFRKAGRGTGVARGEVAAMAVAAVAVIGVIAVFARPAPTAAEVSYADAGVPIPGWDGKLARAVAQPTVDDAALRRAAQGRRLGPQGCWDVADRAEVDACRLRGGGSMDWPAGAGRQVLLYGNSFAAQWRHTLAAILPKGTLLTTVAATACDPSDLTSAARNRTGHGCASTARLALDEARRLKPAVTVFATAFAAKPNATGAMLRELRRRSGSVLWIGFAPATKGFDRCLGGGNDVSACNTPRAQAPLDSAFNRAFRDLARGAGAEYADLIPVYCLNGTCPAFVDGQPIRTDGTHLTMYGMRAAVPVLRRELRSAAGHMAAGR